MDELKGSLPGCVQKRRFIGGKEHHGIPEGEDINGLHGVQRHRETGGLHRAGGGIVGTGSLCRIFQKLLQIVALVEIDPPDDGAEDQKQRSHP